MEERDRLAARVDTAGGRGLGNSAYLLDLGDGRALAVDPSLDLRAVDRATAKRGLRIMYAAETHLDADCLPDGPTTVKCGHGEPAATAASLLVRAGHQDLSILAGGPHDWAKATGGALDTSR